MADVAMTEKVVACHYQTLCVDAQSVVRVLAEEHLHRRLLGIPHLQAPQLTASAMEGLLQEPPFNEASNKLCFFTAQHSACSRSSCREDCECKAQRKVCVCPGRACRCSRWNLRNTTPLLFDGCEVFRETLRWEEWDEASKSFRPGDYLMYAFFLKRSARAPDSCKDPGLFDTWQHTMAWHREDGTGSKVRLALCQVRKVPASKLRNSKRGRPKEDTCGRDDRPPVARCITVDGVAHPPGQQWAPQPSAPKPHPPPLLQTSAKRLSRTPLGEHQIPSFGHPEQSNFTDTLSHLTDALQEEVEPLQSAMKMETDYCLELLEAFPPAIYEQSTQAPLPQASIHVAPSSGSQGSSASLFHRGRSTLEDRLRNAVHSSARAHPRRTRPCPSRGLHTVSRSTQQCTPGPIAQGVAFGCCGGQMHCAPTHLAPVNPEGRFSSNHLWTGQQGTACSTCHCHLHTSAPPWAPRIASAGSCGAHTTASLSCGVAHMGHNSWQMSGFVMDQGERGGGAQCHWGQGCGAHDLGQSWGQGESCSKGAVEVPTESLVDSNDPCPPEGMLWGAHSWSQNEGGGDAGKTLVQGASASGMGIFDSLQELVSVSNLMLGEDQRSAPVSGLPEHVAGPTSEDDSAAVPGREDALVISTLYSLLRMPSPPMEKLTLEEDLDYVDFVFHDVAYGEEEQNTSPHNPGPPQAAVPYPLVVPPRTGLADDEFPEYDPSGLFAELDSVDEDEEERGRLLEDFAAVELGVDLAEGF